MGTPLHTWAGFVRLNHPTVIGATVRVEFRLPEGASKEEIMAAAHAAAQPYIEVRAVRCALDPKGDKP